MAIVSLSTGSHYDPVAHVRPVSFLEILKRHALCEFLVPLAEATHVHHWESAISVAHVLWVLPSAMFPWAVMVKNLPVSLSCVSGTVTASHTPQVSFSHVSRAKVVRSAGLAWNPSTSTKELWGVEQVHEPSFAWCPHLQQRSHNSIHLPPGLL